jgi:quercetin dioxygenase-like cupin family protein
MNAENRQPNPASLRVLLIDDHEISRAACRALLLTEGVGIVADDGVGENAIMLAAQLKPHVVILDVSPVDDAALALARRLRSLETSPTVVLTSSAPAGTFGARLNGYSFIPKADLCTGEVRKAIPSAPIQGETMSRAATTTDQTAQPLWFLHNLAIIHVRSDQTNGSYAVVEMTGAPRDTPPLHLHVDDDEGFYVLDGALGLHVQGQPVVHLGPGQFAIAPRGIPHVYVVESEIPSRWLAISSGGFVRFVEEVSVPAGKRTLPVQPHLPPPDELAVTAARHGIEILGPPGTMPGQGFPVRKEATHALRR